jgi:23S rRNA pseudouridine1911/1915/1917 synthase
VAPESAGLSLTSEAPSPRPWGEPANAGEPADDEAILAADEIVDRQLPPGADPSWDWGLTSHLRPDGTAHVIERRLIVGTEHSGLRLDHFVKTQIPRLSRTKIQHVIAETLQIESSAQPAAKHGQSPTALRSNRRVAIGDVFVLRRDARPEPPCPRLFQILHDDPDVLVIDKPAGLPVHSTAKFYFNTLTRIMFETLGPGLQLCHRIDRETSGAVVVAKHREAASTITQAFAHKQVQKLYIALVHGHPPWPPADAATGEHCIDQPLRLATAQDATKLVGLRMIVGDGGTSSKTMVSVIARSRRFSLIQCRPVTGRQHQIRAHLAAAGFPIVGDKIYAHGDQAFIDFCDQGWTAQRAATFVLWRHGLHASQVDFPHPGGGRCLVNSPLPADIALLFNSDVNVADVQSASQERGGKHHLLLDHCQG